MAARTPEANANRGSWFNVLMFLLILCHFLGGGAKKNKNSEKL